MFFHSCWCYLVGDVEPLDVRVGGAAGCLKWVTREGPLKVVASFRFLPHLASWSSVTWTLFPHAPTTWDSSMPFPPWWAETFDTGSQNDCLSVVCCLRNCPQQIFCLLSEDSILQEQQNIQLLELIVGPLKYIIGSLWQLCMRLKSVILPSFVSGGPSV